MATPDDVISSDPRTWTARELGKIVHVDQDSAGLISQGSASSWGVRGVLLKVTHEHSAHVVSTTATLLLGSGDQINVLVGYDQPS